MQQKAEPVLVGLLLAAGSSERLGQPKQLVQWQGESLLRRTAGMLLAETDEVVVVSGAFAAEIEGDLKGIPVRIQHNDDWRSGMGGSIAAGMCGINRQADAVLIMLCDQWKIEPADLQSLIQTWKEEPAIVATAHWDNTPGPPTIIPHHLFGELSQLHGPQGARSLIRRQSRVNKVDIPNAQHDLDTAADLQMIARGKGKVGKVGKVGSESGARVKAHNLCNLQRREHLLWHLTLTPL